MARSIFATTFQFLSDLIARPNNTPPSQNDVTSSPTQKRQNDQRERDSVPPESSYRYGGLFGYGDKKRKGVYNGSEPQAKRRAVNIDQRPPVSYHDENNSSSSLHEHADTIQVLNVSGGKSKADIDRSLMPPPATPRRGANESSSPFTTQEPTGWARDDDAISFASTAMTKQRIDDVDNDNMEAARRHAAAIRLPENSGVWSQTERELFFHLAYRGFEPLLPQNWMLDFDTLPISVFVHEHTTDPPIIQNIKDNQFRAAHALRRLFEAGHDVRDRNHISPGSRREKILERAVKRYLYWALTDVGLRPSSAATTTYLPVHIVVTKRKGRSTLQTLEEVATKLNSLSERHQQEQDVRPSIEPQDVTFLDVNETRVSDDDNSPTLIGLVIISSVLAIVTLSPFSPAPEPAEIRAQTASPPDSDPTPDPGTNADRLRIIAELDFSQRDQDVWNALGVAIVAMQIRREALKANLGSEDPDDFEGISVTGSRFDDSMDNTSRLVHDPDL